MSEQRTAESHLVITDLTDITDVYFQYGLALSNATVTNSYTFSGSGEIGWSTTYPTWIPGYQIWIRQVRIKEGVASPEYGTPYLDNAINQINTKIRKIWSDSTGSYMASGIGGNDVTESNVSTYGFNSKSTTTGVSFNYNAISLTSLGTDGLKLYSPILTNSVITGNRLDATLTSEGLKLLKGGIEAGTKNTTNYIYVYSHDDAINHTLAINNSGNKSDWRIIAGNKFGVDKAGNLYASNANITGAITVSDTANSNVYTTSKTDELLGGKASTNAEYSVEIKVDFSNVYNTQNSTVVLTATAYKLGIATTGSFIWYKNTIGTAHGGQVSSSGTGNSDNVLTVSSSNFNNVYIAVLQ